MGKIFDDLTYATPKHLYMGAPVDEIKALNAQKSEDYKINKLENDKLDIALNNLDIRDVDYDLKKRKIQEQKEAVKSIVENGDWQNAKTQVTQQVKNFATDQEIQGMQQAKKLQQAHHAEVDKEVEENKKSKKWGDYEKTISSNTAIGRDENGKITGGYGARKVLNDKQITAEIYDKMDKRINDWKPDTFQTIGGVDYKLTDGQYFKKGQVEAVNPNEVKQALKNELQNSYGDFLNQEKQIDLYHLKGGKNRNIEPTDFNKVFGFETSDEIINAATQSSPEYIDKLAKSTSKEDRDLAAKLKTERELAAKDLSSETGRDGIFDRLYSTQQENKYVQGATNKASYTKESSDWMLNHGYVEKLKHDYKKKELAYDDELKNKRIPPAASTTSELLTTPSKTMEQHQADFSSTTTELSQAEKAIKTVDPNSPLYKTLQKSITDLRDKKRIITSNIVNTVDLANETNPKVGETVSKYLGEDMINDVLKNPKDYSKTIQEFVKQRQKEKPAPTYYDANNASLYQEATNKQLLNMIKKEPNYKEKLGNLLLKQGNDFKKNEIWNTINSSLVDAKEKNKQVIVYGYDENTDKDFYRSYIDPVATMIKNNTSVFKIMGTDTTLGNYLEDANGFSFTGKIGRAKVDLQKSKFSMVSDPENGDKMMKVTLYDTEGNPIIEEGGERNKIKEIFVTSASGEADFSFGSAFSRMIESSDKNTVKQGLQLEGVEKFGTSGSHVDLNNPKFKQEEARFSINGQDKNIVIKRKGDTNVFELFNKNGTPFNLPTEDFSGRATNYVGGKAELYTRLNIQDHAE